MHLAIETGGRRNGRLVLLPFLLVLLAGCLTLRLTEPYDPVIEQGLQSYREHLNAFVIKMGQRFGTPQGTYSANLDSYAELDAEVGTLIARARINAEGHGCALPASVSQRLAATFGEAGVPAVVAPSAQSPEGTDSGCTLRLMEILETQLAQLADLHRIVDPVTGMTGLRPATSETLLRIMNQAIDAAWIVEQAKREES